MIHAMKMIGFTRCPVGSTKAEVLRISGSLIDGALHRVEHPSTDREDDVHLFRATTKRLRALLQLIRPVISRTAWKRETERLKKAASRLAHLRDRAVAAETLASLGYSAAVLRQCGLAAFKPNGHRDALQLAARDLEGSRRGFQRLRIGTEGWGAVGPGLERTYKQARQRMKASFADPGDELFHRWRIRVKQLYFQLEWLEALLPKRFAVVLKCLRKLGDDLGSDHDLVVLCDLLGNASGTSESTRAIRNIKKSAAQRSRLLREKSHSLGVKILSETPRRFFRRCPSHWRRPEIGAGAFGQHPRQ